MNRVIWLVPLVILLHGCANEIQTATMTTTPTMVSMQPQNTRNGATNTTEPSPTPTILPSPAPTLAPTPLFDERKVGYDFLFANQPEGCDLPCWQGLRIEQSNKRDIQTMYENAFGFQQGIDRFEVKSFDKRGLHGTGAVWNWVVTQNDVQSFGVTTWIDPETEVLRLMQFWARRDEFEPYTNPRRLLLALGRPDYVLSTVPFSEVGTQGGMDFWIIYNKGISAHYYIFIHNIDRGVFPLCLGRMPVYGTYDVRVNIGGPLTHPLNMLTEYEQWTADYFPTSTNGRYVGPDPESFERVFKTSIDELMVLVTSDENACLQGKVFPDN